MFQTIDQLEKDNSTDIEFEDEGLDIRQAINLSVKVQELDDDNEEEDNISKNSYSKPLNLEILEIVEEEIIDIASKTIVTYSAEEVVESNPDYLITNMKSEMMIDNQNISPQYYSDVDDSSDESSTDEDSVVEYMPDGEIVRKKSRGFKQLSNCKRFWKASLMGE